MSLTDEEPAIRFHSAVIQPLAARLQAVGGRCFPIAPEPGQDSYFEASDASGNQVESFESLGATTSHGVVAALARQWRAQGNEAFAAVEAEFRALAEELVDQRDPGVQDESINDHNYTLF